MTAGTAGALGRNEYSLSYLGGTGVELSVNVRDLSAPLIDAGSFGSFVYQPEPSVSMTATVPSTVENFVGFSSGHTYTWSVDTGPDGHDTDFATTVEEYDTGDVLSTEVTFTVAGNYVLRVEFDDSAVTYYDTLEVTVYENGCLAAKAENPYSDEDAREKGDTNYDCEVNLADFAAVASHWLVDASTI